MNLVVIGCVHFLIFLNSILAQSTIPFDDEMTTNEITINTALSSPYGIQLKKFSELAHGLRSGPIIIVNQTTFFVPNLHYDGKGPDAHFWAGIGTMPNATGILVPDENGSIESLRAYNGEDVYITLPKGLTVNSIDYFGLWCIAYNVTFGYVTIRKDLDVPDTSNIDNNKLITRVQKCCPIDQSMDADFKCVIQNKQFNPKLDVRTGPNEDLVYAPFINNIDCTKTGKHLEAVDDVSLLSNGSISKNQSMWNQDEYCLETFYRKNETKPVWKTMAVVCKSNGNAQHISSISLNLLLLILSCKIILF